VELANTIESTSKPSPTYLFQFPIVETLYFYRFKPAIVAFHVTEYRVDDADSSFILRIGEHSLPLQLLHEAHRVTSTVYLTVWNPLGEIASLDCNAESQAALKHDLDDLGFTVLSGEGRDPSSDWAELLVVS
jgi:hypothetical protein